MIHRLITSIFSRGFKNTFILIFDQVYDILQDLRYSIETFKRVSGSALGYDGTTCIAYSPYRYRNLYKIFKNIAPPTEKDVFLDYGCGKGRVMVFASTYPFRKVIGVELSPKLRAIAERNIRRAYRKTDCEKIQVATADAASYVPPDDATHFFFYNPFGNDILEQVFEKIHASLIKNPRDITVIYTPPNGNPPTVLDEYGWLKKQQELPIFPRFYNNVVRIYSNK